MKILRILTDFIVWAIVILLMACTGYMALNWIAGYSVSFNQVLGCSLVYFGLIAFYKLINKEL